MRGPILTNIGFFATGSLRRLARVSSFMDLALRAIGQLRWLSVPAVSRGRARTMMNEGERWCKGLLRFHNNIPNDAGHWRTVTFPYPMPFHGGDRGSNPLGDANYIRELGNIDTV
jgi:hypothetical protein